MNVICRTFNIKLNYFGSVMPKKLKTFEKLNKSAIKCEKRVTMNISKTSSL